MGVWRFAQVGDPPQQHSRKILLQLEDVDDVFETRHGFVVVTKSGEKIRLDEETGRKVYWEVKSRNRRRVFGL